MSKKLTHDIFLERCKSVHGDYYDHSKFIFDGVDTKGVVICFIHGEFNITPYQHINRKQGCKKCGFIKKATSKRISFKNFLSRSNKIHNNFYDYSLAEKCYVDTRKEIPIICPNHGEFSQSPISHLVGSGCLICGRIRTSIKRIKSNEYFLQICKGVHNDEYEYLSSYNGSRNYIQIKHKKCGTIFEQSANNHHKGKGCPYCKLFKGELKIAKLLNKSNIKFIMQKTFDMCKSKHKLRFDFYLPDYNIIIEYDGIQHFRMKQFNNCSYMKSMNSFLDLVEKDFIKNNYCDINNIKLIRIPYWDFDNIEEILFEKIGIK